MVYGLGSRVKDMTWNPEKSWSIHRGAQGFYPATTNRDP